MNNPYELDMLIADMRMQGYSEQEIKDYLYSLESEDKENGD